MLDLLNSIGNIPYIYQTCATEEEFYYYLRQWKLNRYSEYPILYIASHGNTFEIDLSGKTIALDDIAKELQSSCSNRILMFSSCSTMDIDKKHLKRFLQQTDALIICGYCSDVEFLKSAAFEILILDEIQNNEFSGRGIDSIQKKIKEISNSFPELDFRMVTNKE